MADLLRVARQQYHLLKDNNLLTASMASEFEELERQICQEAGASLEPAPYLTSRKPLLEASGATPAQEVPWAGDDEDSVRVWESRCCPLPLVLCAGGAGGGTCSSQLWAWGREASFC